MRPWEARFGPELDWEKLWRDQVFGAKMTETNGHKLLFSRDSEAALGSQSATMGGSFWTRIRLGKAVAGPGVRGQDDRDKWKETCFFSRSRDSEAASGTQSATMGGSFWTRIRLGKAVAGPGVRGQDDRDKWKQTCLFLGLGIQRRRLAPKVRPWEARFGCSGPR